MEGEFEKLFGIQMPLTTVFGLSYALFEHGANYLDYGCVFPPDDNALTYIACFSARIEACRRAAGAATHALRAKGVLKDLAVMIG